MAEKVYPFMKRMARKIKQARMEAGLSQDELAEKMSRSSNTYISKIEAGQRLLKISQLLEIAQALHKPAGWFIDESAQLDEEAHEKAAKFDRLQKLILGELDKYIKSKYGVKAPRQRELDLEFVLKREGLDSGQTKKAKEFVEFLKKS